MVVLAVIVLLAVVAVVFGIVAFNRLIRARNLVADGWAGIDVQLTRRAELVPNLVEVVKGYQVHEAQALEQVTAARSRAQQAKDVAGPAATGQAEAQLSRSVGSLLAVAEAYPDLKANTNFLDLQRELATLEEDIAFARQYYNAVVRKYNTLQQTFPVVLMARPFGFRTSEYFQADIDNREAPDVTP